MVVFKVVKRPRKSNEFASCSVDCTVCIWNLEKDQPLQILEGHYGYVVDLCWLSGASDGLLATAAYDGTARIWDGRNGECVHVLEEHQDAVVKVSAKPDGKYVATAGHDGFVRVWNVQHGDCVAHQEGPGRMLQVCPLLKVSKYQEYPILQLSATK